VRRAQTGQNGTDGTAFKQRMSWKRLL